MNKQQPDEIINLIHNDIDKINNDDVYAFHILKKIMPHNKVMKEILTFDLLNYHPNEKVNSLDELVQIAVRSFRRFQNKVGGFNIEDKDWIIVEKDNHRFRIKDNQKVLYNSVDKRHCDKELVWFINNITTYIQNYADKDKFSVKYTVKEDNRYRICWVVIIVTQI